MTVFTDHAREKIRTELERFGITERVVEGILEGPDDLLYDTATGRFVALDWSRNVAVIYEEGEAGRGPTVITVIYSSRLREVVGEKEEGWKVDLILRYDPKADILVIKLREGAVRDEELLDGDVVLGLDEEGKLASLEIWEASKRGLLKALVALASERRELAEAILRATRAGSA